MRLPWLSFARGRIARVYFLASLLPFLPTSSLSAQTRPLRTPEAETLPAGTLRAQVGFDFLQDVSFPLSGLSGDLTAVGVVNLRMGVGRLVEVQLEGAVRNFLDVKSRTVGPVIPLLPASSSTHDTGDFSLSTKLRIFREAPRRPALSLLFGFQMPNSNQARGIGTNTSNLFASLLLQKHFGKLNVFGSAGLAILQSPTANFTQNDVFTYGLAFLYPLNRRVSLAGEVFGRYSARTITTRLVGTESRGQGRLGLQITAGGFVWDFAGIAGLARHDPRSGFTFGLSKDIRLFDYGTK